MRLDEAWAATLHGRAMVRPSGARIEKWVGDKPGLAASFDRFLADNAGTIPSSDLMAGDWTPEA